jgi:hypothetical protein
MPADLTVEGCCSRVLSHRIRSEASIGNCWQPGGLGFSADWWRWPETASAGVVIHLAVVGSASDTDTLALERTKKVRARLYPRGPGTNVRFMSQAMVTSLQSPRSLSIPRNMN